MVLKSKDGTGTAAGKNGDVAMEVSLEGNKITGVTD